MLLDYEIISSREYRLICTLTHTMLEYCPESHRREAAKTMIIELNGSRKENKMLCDSCHQKEAVIHMTQVVNGRRSERHLCPGLCQERKFDQRSV